MSLSEFLKKKETDKRTTAGQSTPNTSPEKSEERVKKIKEVLGEAFGDGTIEVLEASLGVPNHPVPKIHRKVCMLGMNPKEVPDTAISEAFKSNTALNDFARDVVSLLEASKGYGIPAITDSLELLRFGLTAMAFNGKYNCVAPGEAVRRMLAYNAAQTIEDMRSLWYPFTDEPTQKVYFDSLEKLLAGEITMDEMKNRVRAVDQYKKG